MQLSGDPLRTTKNENNMRSTNPIYPLFTRILPLILLLVVSFSCKKNGNSVDFVAEEKADLAYGGDPRQKLDLYLPDNRSQTTTKLIIIIHGGGWSDGDKKDVNGYVSALQTRLPDYAIANINYRLAKNGQNLFPAQEEDIKKAVTYLMNHADNYGYRQKYVLLGLSAGAHLSLLHSYKYPVPYRASAVVSFFGPTDLFALYNNPPGPYIPTMLQAVTGTTPVLNPGLYMQSSPTNFVNAQSSATLLLQGGRDPLVPVSQAEMLKAKLDANRVPAGYIYYANEAHGWIGSSLEDSFNQIKAFLDANVK